VTFHPTRSSRESPLKPDRKRKVAQRSIEQNLSASSNLPPIYQKNETLQQLLNASAKTVREKIEAIVAPDDLGSPIVSLTLFENEAQSPRYTLGAPRLRTLWRIQNVSVTFSELVVASGALPIPKNGEVGRYQVGVYLWLGGVRYPFFLNEAPMTNLTTFESITGELHSGIGVEYLRRKQYVLELQSPIELSRSFDLGISIFLKESEKQKLAKQITATMIAPFVTVTLEQERLHRAA
jgi:hypothetical protein